MVMWRLALICLALSAVVVPGYAAEPGTDFTGLKNKHKPPKPKTPPAKPLPPIKPKSPKEPKEPPPPVDPLARFPEAGTQPAETFNPNMFGDLFGSRQQAIT